MDSSDLECRVCRSGPEDTRPLLTPCLCSGSIGLVHQSCLEEWLNHSKKDTCELCMTKYQFTPLYADNAPVSLPTSVMIGSILNITVKTAIPFAFRFALAIVIWLAFVPITITSIYCFCVGRRNVMFTITHDDDWMPKVFAVMVCGLVLVAIMATSLLILMSFTDFLRFHWLPNDEAQQPNEVAVGARPVNNRQLPNPRRPVRRVVVPRGGAGAARGVQGAAPAPAGPEAGAANGEEGAQGGAAAIDEVDPNNEQADAPIAPPDANQQPADQPAHQNAAAAAAVEDDAPIGLEDVQEVGLEIRVALFELLGVEGPMYLMVRNALWLLAFSFVYLALMISGPLRIGRMALSVLSEKLMALGVLGAFTSFPALVSAVADTGVVQLVELVVEQSTKAHFPLHFMDFVVVATGFVSIFCVVFVLHLLGLLCQLVWPNGPLKLFSAMMAKLALVVKVGMLLVVRIFLMPMFLGSLILSVASKTVVRYSLETWAQFLVSNSVGAYGLMWSVGITFMLSMTISVLQLREVLHPAFFARTIRPQEAHHELISSLVEDGLLVHARRVLVSLMVYMALMMLFLYAPLHILKTLHVWAAPQSTDSLLTVKVWYVIPQLQLPLELLLCHITFLSVLDKKKDIVGQLQFHWLSRVCGLLGLTRFVLPCPMIKKPKPRNIVDQLSGVFAITNSESSCESSIVARDASIEAEPSSSTLPDEEYFEVGPPLVRPPPGWDLRQNNTTRWAWGTEPLSEVESNVAPRVAPSFWLLRVVVLAVLSWLLVVSIVLFVLVVPLFVGRTVFRAVQWPDWMLHDPICFLLGCVMCSIAASFFSNLQVARIVSSAASLGSMSLSVGLKVVKITCMWVLAELSVGVITSLLSNPLVASQGDIDFVSKMDLLGVLLVWVKGMLIVETVLALLFSNNTGTFLISLFGMEEHLTHWRVAVQRVTAEIRQSFRGSDPWSLQSLPLDDIEQLLVWPLFKRLVLMGSLPVVSLSLLFGVDPVHPTALVLETVTRNLKGFSLAVCALWLLALLSMPAKLWLSALHTRIRDDAYLIGRKLQNINEITPQGL